MVFYALFRYTYGLAIFFANSIGATFPTQTGSHFKAR